MRKLSHAQRHMMNQRTTLKGTAKRMQWRQRKRAEAAAYAAERDRIKNANGNHGRNKRAAIRRAATMGIDQRREQQ
jgi:hypothetical protein